MRIIDVLDPAAVLPELRGRDKRGVLEELSAVMSPALGVDGQRIAAQIEPRQVTGRRRTGGRADMSIDQTGNHRLSLGYIDRGEN